MFSARMLCRAQKREQELFQNAVAGEMGQKGSKALFARFVRSDDGTQKQEKRGRDRAPAPR